MLVFIWYNQIKKYLNFYVVYKIRLPIKNAYTETINNYYNLNTRIFSYQYNSCEKKDSMVTYKID